MKIRSKLKIIIHFITKIWKGVCERVRDERTMKIGNKLFQDNFAIELKEKEETRRKYSIVIVRNVLVRVVNV